MMPNILGCLILEEDTGLLLFSHFFDPALKKNTSVIPQKVKSKEIRMVHEFGAHTVFTALVTHETPEVREYLRTFKTRVDKVYPDGLQKRRGNFADILILQNIVAEVFVENEKRTRFLGICEYSHPDEDEESP